MCEHLLLTLVCEVPHRGGHFLAQEYISNVFETLAGVLLNEISRKIPQHFSIALPSNSYSSGIFYTVTQVLNTMQLPKYQDLGYFMLCFYLG